MSAKVRTQFTEQDAEDFNHALSLVFIGSSIEHPSSVDYAVHLRNLCAMAATKLCDIRNRIAPDAIELSSESPQ
jgi:hypothetical protein